MPVWVQIAVPAIAAAWAAWLVLNWLEGVTSRRRNLELFDEWMRRSRDG